MTQREGDEAGTQLSAAAAPAKGDEHRFQRLLEGVHAVAVQGYDRRRRVIFWNEASTRLYGYTAAEAMGRQL